MLGSSGKKDLRDTPKSDGSIRNVLKNIAQWTSRTTSLARVSNAKNTLTHYFNIKIYKTDAKKLIYDMIMKDWKIELQFWDDDCQDDDLRVILDEKLPYLPRVGEIIWTSRNIEMKADDMVKECWRENKCDGCPFMYGHKKNEEDIGTYSFIYVRSIIYRMSDKIVSIELQK